MLIAEFKNIAADLGATLNIIEDRINVEGGASSPNVVFSLIVNYKSKVIRIENATGTYFVGNIYCQVSELKPSLEFNISAKSHFLTLFSKNKDRFRIKTDNENIKAFFRQSKGFYDMRQIADKEMFDPTIIGQNNNNKFELIVEYHIQFNNWWEVIKPTVEFYKEFIDKFA